jgi:hypothetical protein
VAARVASKVVFPILKQLKGLTFDLVSIIFVSKSPFL